MKIPVIIYSVNIHEAANSLSPSQAFQQNLPQRRQDISQIPPDPVLTFMGNRNTHGLGGAMGNRKTHGFPSSSSNNKEGASLSQIFSPSILHLIPDTKTMQEKLFDVDQVSCPLELYFYFNIVRITQSFAHLSKGKRDLKQKFIWWLPS